MVKQFLIVMFIIIIFILGVNLMSMTIEKYHINELFGTFGFVVLIIAAYFACKKFTKE